MEFTQPATAFSSVKVLIIRNLSVILIAIMTFAILSVMLFARVATQPTNPFLDYADILPGQPEPAIESHTFNCQTPSMNNYVQQYTTCTSNFLDGAFSQITLFVTQKTIIQSTFKIRENRLKFGDLMQSMEMTHLQSHPYEIFFFWKNLFVTVKTTLMKHATALRPIWSVTFTDVNLQGKSQIFSATPHS